MGKKPAKTMAIGITALSFTCAQIPVMAYGQEENEKEGKDSKQMQTYYKFK